MRVVIVEDDLAQAVNIAALVAQLRPGWHVHDLVHDRVQLAQALEEVVPDIVLLDLHIPEHPVHPYSVLEHIKTAPVSPVVILITGDPTMALEAYEKAVADYVVKPPRPARLAQALERAEELVFARRTASSVPAASRGPVPATQWLNGFRGRDMVMIDPSEIIFLQADRKYTTAHLPQGQVLIRYGISDVELRVDMNDFVRIHRSTIVQIKYIEFIRRDEMGRLRVHMKGRSEGLMVSRPFEHVFKDA